MSRLIILEGCRGVGKSSLASNLRQTVPEITLINPTGFHLDGQEGLDRSTEYYFHWLEFFYRTKNLDIVFVCDRYFFTEMVFATLYKDYDFTNSYELFIRALPQMVSQVDIIHYKINDPEQLKERLVRDKVKFYKVQENVEEAFKQQLAYTELFSNLEWFYSETDNVEIHTVDTTGKDMDEVKKETRQLLGFENA